MPAAEETAAKVMTAAAGVMKRAARVGGPARTRFFRLILAAWVGGAVVVPVPVSGALAPAIRLAGVLVPGEPRAPQSRPDLRIMDGRRILRVPLYTDRGAAAVPLWALDSLGWRTEEERAGVLAAGPQGDTLRIQEGLPFARWNGATVQLTDAPYRDGGQVFIPVQILTDFLPARHPRAYAFDGPSMTLRAGSAVGAEAASPAAPGAGAPSGADAAHDASEDTLYTPSPYRGIRMVIIDAGHGGEDPGSMSRSGLREKNVALAVALATARRLEGEPGLEVRLIRSDDTLVPLWNRGIIATEMKGERPGVFVSIHANSFNSPARGFETYFLSEARTDHERRVAAVENTPLRLEDGAVDPDDDLGFILKELRNLDQQHWSALLAELVQGHLDPVHPGPNRGVKQGPLAVLTNAIMPAVLVEVGYLSNPAEARLLGDRDFQEKAGEAVAEAVLEFFQRYPPGSGGGAENPR